METKIYCPATPETGFERPSGSPVLNKVLTTRFIAFSSRDRSLTLFPRASRFEVRLPNVVKNVVSARVLQCALPNTSEINSAHLIYVKINDFGNVSNAQQTESFAAVSSPCLNNGLVQLNPTALLAVRPDPHLRGLTVVERLQVALFDHAGAPILLPEESSVDEAAQVHLVVELSVLA
jgi:hypothetical protein